MNARQGLKQPLHYFLNSIPGRLWLFGWVLTLLILPTPQAPISDSRSRMLEAHWIWSGADPGGALIGRDGAHHFWFGLGQILIFLPVDWTVDHLGLHSTALRVLAITYLVFPVINGGVLALGFLVLRELGFCSRTALISTLSLQFLTTLLWHFQNNQENPLILLLALVTVIALLRWHRTNVRSWLHLAAAAQSFALMIRIPNLAIAGALFLLPLVLTVLNSQSNLRQNLRAAFIQSRQIISACIPWLLLAIIADRWWQWYRFGSLTTTYMDGYAVWMRTQTNDVAPGFPFHNPFWDGILGQLFSPAKSIFVYEPLWFPGLVILWLGRKRWPAAVTALALCASLALVGSMIGMARFCLWHSDPNWGPRYLATPAHLLELPAGALIYHWIRSRWARVVIWLATGILAIVGVSSLYFVAYHELKLDPKKPYAFAQTGWREGVWVGGNADFRFLNRPFLIVTDYRHELNRTAAWTASPPLRLLFPFQPLQSLRPEFRWSLRTVWVAVALTLFLIIRKTLQRASREDGQWLS